MTKFTTGFCATGQMMHWWGQQETATCPRCGYESKTIVHILQCPNQAAQLIVDQNTEELRTLLKDLDMDPNTMEDLSKGFHTWSSNQLGPQMLTDAGCLQSFISWDNFSHGFLTVSWQTQQQAYYENKQLWRSGEKWAREVLKWVLKSMRH